MKKLGTLLMWFVLAFLTTSSVGCSKGEDPKQPFQYGPTTGQVGGQTPVKPAKMAPPQGATYCLGGPCPASSVAVPSRVPGAQPLVVPGNGGLPRMTITETGKVYPQDPLNGIEHGVRQVTRATQYGLAWFLLVTGIMFAGPLFILLIPGLIAGRSEKLLEGAVMVAWGIFMVSLTSDAGVSSLTPWVWGVLIVPGALLFVWGIFSDNESGKFLLVTGPVMVFGVYLFSQMYRMIVMGVVSSALFTFLILLFAVMILVGTASRLGKTTATA